MDVSRDAELDEQFEVALLGVRSSFQRKVVFVFAKCLLRFCLLCAVSLVFDCPFRSEYWKKNWSVYRSD